MVDDGTCNYIADTNEETGMSEDLRGYVTKTLSNVWSHNFKGSDTEPKDWGSTGYSYRGQKVSQRDIMRLVCSILFLTLLNSHLFKLIKAYQFRQINLIEV